MAWRVTTIICHFSLSGGMRPLFDAVNGIAEYVHLWNPSQHSIISLLLFGL